MFGQNPLNPYLLHINLSVGVACGLSEELMTLGFLLLVMPNIPAARKGRARSNLIVHFGTI